MDMKNRIKDRLSKLDKTMASASRDAGLNDAYIRQLLVNDTQFPTTDKLENLAKALETTPAWLLSGEGEEAIVQDDKSFFDLVDIWRALTSKDQIDLLNHIEAWRNLPTEQRLELNNYVEFLQSKK